MDSPPGPALLPGWPAARCSAPQAEVVEMGPVALAHELGVDDAQALTIITAVSNTRASAPGQAEDAPGEGDQVECVVRVEAIERQLHRFLGLLDRESGHRA